MGKGGWCGVGWVTGAGVEGPEGERERCLFRRCSSNTTGIALIS